MVKPYADLNHASASDKDSSKSKPCHLKVINLKGK